jgi:transcriptional regulator with XRE-family HTH domain
VSETFGEKLQRLREEAGISQAELSRRSGAPLDSVRNWEQNRNLPRIDAATRLARALGVSLDLLAVDAQADAGHADAGPPAEQKGKGKGRGAKKGKK